MARKSKKKVVRSSRYFEFSSELRADFQKLFTRSFMDMTASEQEMFVGIGSWCADTGLVSYRQLQVVGFLYKKYLQDGEYVHHNWKIWRSVAVKAS